MKYIKRLIALPLMMVFILIPTISLYFLWLKNFMLHGGEFVSYTKKNERKRISHIYELLKNNHETKSITSNKSKG